MKKFYFLIAVVVILLAMPLIMAVNWGDPVWRDLHITGAPLCDDSGNTPVWKTWNRQEQRFDISPSNDDCYREDGKSIDNFLEDRTTCCKENYYCDLNENECKQNQEHREKCSDLETESECNSWQSYRSDIFPYLDNLFATQRDLDEFCGEPLEEWFDTDLNQNCWNITSCGCFWDDDDDECEPGWEYKDPICSRSTFGKCTVDSLVQDNKCNTTGIMTQSIVYKWTSSSNTQKPSYCNDITKQIPCRPSVRLAFFTATNMIIAIIIIALIYISYSYLKKKTK